MRLSQQHDPIGPDVRARPLDRIVVGIDFTEVSLAAAQWVGRHLARDANLTLVHVIADPLVPNVARLRSRRLGGRFDGPFRARLRSLRGALRGLAAVIGGARTAVEVRVGDPARQLAAYADMVDANLVVVGGNSSFHAAPREETATTDRLLRHLTRPALVARNAPSPPTTVLAALADDVVGPVLAFARKVAAMTGARVAALRLSDRRSGGPVERVEPVPGETTICVGTRDALAKSEQVRIVVDVAREQRADVIVIGSYASATDGDDDVARMLARTATCSVLVVPHPSGPRSRRPLHLSEPASVQRPPAAGAQSDDAGPPRPAATVCGTDDAA